MPRRNKGKVVCFDSVTGEGYIISNNIKYYVTKDSIADESGVISIHDRVTFKAREINGVKLAKNVKIFKKSNENDYYSERQYGKVIRFVRGEGTIISNYVKYYVNKREIIDEKKILTKDDKVSFQVFIDKDDVYCAKKVQKESDEKDNIQFLKKIKKRDIRRNKLIKKDSKPVKDINKDIETLNGKRKPNYRKERYIDGIIVKINKKKKFGFIKRLNGTKWTKDWYFNGENAKDFNKMYVNDRVKYVLDNPKMNIIYVLKIEKIKWKINSNIDNDIVSELIICEKKINNLDNIMQMQKEIYIKNEINSNYCENKSDIYRENNIVNGTDKMISECKNDNSINKNFNSLITEIDNQNNNNKQEERSKKNKKNKKKKYVNNRINKSNKQDTRDVNQKNDSTTDGVSEDEVISHEILSIEEINKKTEEFRQLLMSKHYKKKNNVNTSTNSSVNSEDINDICISEDISDV